MLPPRKIQRFFPPNEIDPSSKTKKVVKPLKANKKKSEGRTSKSAVKKAREETADSQSCEISQNLALNMMKVIRHGVTVQWNSALMSLIVQRLENSVDNCPK